MTVVPIGVSSLIWKMAVRRIDAGVTDDASLSKTGETGA
jgi:hypothetical protein